MKNIFTIALNTFRESIRDKIFYAVGFFALIFAVILFYISTASLGEETHVMRSLGLGGTYIFGIILTILLSSSLLSKEFDKKTIYFIFSRPVTSMEIVFGKFLGLFMTIAAATALFSGVYLAMVYLGASLFDAKALLAFSLQLCEMSLFIALIIFFSSFTRPSLSTMATIAILYLGHSSTLLSQTAEQSGGAPLQTATRLLFYIVPDLEKFDIRNSVIYGFPLSSAEIGYAVFYSVCLVAFFLGAASVFLKKRDI
jgi:ABC-type transport system involved in multi-copper enzyme maturation permease subunit